VRVSVTGLNASAASVRLRGGIAGGGKWFSWVSLRDNGGGSWFTVLRAPGYLGVYPVEVRAAGRTYQTAATVSILPRGFGARPAFPQPEAAAEWWARLAPAGAILRNVATWRAGFFTHRDERLNRLLVVRYRLLGPWARFRLPRGDGRIFLSIARLRDGGRWRLLEVVRAP
jgi:hypothetical protein